MNLAVYSNKKSIRTSCSRKAKVPDSELKENMGIQGLLSKPPFIVTLKVLQLISRL
jgi:hypothetical protein